MHDPMTMAFDLKNPISRRSWISIWHVDPEKDHTDDSCGWFIRPRHCDQKKLELIVKRFEEDFDRVWTSDSHHTYQCGFFTPVCEGDPTTDDGMPIMSEHAIALNLFFIACNVHFSSDGRSNWKKSRKWMQAHLFDILFFAENPTDSLHDGFTRKFENGCREIYTKRIRDERIRSLAGCIYSYILRADRPWWKHPRWHIHHWHIQWHFGQRLWRWLAKRCESCGKRIPMRGVPLFTGKGFICSKCSCYGTATAL